MPNLLRVFSFKSREEIEALALQSAERPAARAGQRALAAELTTLVHGEQETQRAIAASRPFGQGELDELDERTLAAAVAGCAAPGGSPRRRAAAAGEPDGGPAWWSRSRPRAAPSPGAGRT